MGQQSFGKTIPRSAGETSIRNRLIYILYNAKYSTIEKPWSKQDLDRLGRFAALCYVIGVYT
jgi:hypothetical protein